MTNLIDIKYSKQELATYANSSDTCVTLVRKTRDVLLHPVQLSDLSAGVRQNLDALLLKYDYMFNSIILGYNRIKILSKCGLICPANARIKVQIEADFYLFNPAVGSKLKGVVCKRSGHHLGCLVHKAFNAYIPTKDDSHMSELYYFIGQDLTFTVVDLDLTSGRLPYLRGQLDDENTERNDGDGIVNQVGPDSGTSFSHEEDAGGWDSGIALSSPGKNTIVNEELESEDKCNYGMKRKVGESRLTSKAIQLAARNTKNELTNKTKNSPKTVGSVDSLSNIAKVLDKYYSSQDYGISDDESQQLMQETVRGSESFSTGNSSTPIQEKSKSKSKRNKTPLKTSKCLKETCDPENSSDCIKSDGRTGNTAKEIIGKVDMTFKAISTSPNKKVKSISKKNCSSPGNDDMIKQLLKSMERSFTEEETDVSENKVSENTAILSSPVKVVEEREEIDNDGGSKPKLQETKGDSGVSFKSPSSTTKRRKSTSKVKNISIPENKYLESGGSLTDLNESIKDEDSKLRQESQENLGGSGSPSVDSVLAVRKKHKSNNSTDKSPLKSNKCAIESLGEAKSFIREVPKTVTLVQSDGKTEHTVQKNIDIASNVTPFSTKKKRKSTSKKNRSSPSSDDLIKQLLQSMERSFAEEETDVSEREDLKNTAIIPPPVQVVEDSEGLENEDKSKIKTQEGSEVSKISMNPSSTSKKRKSISKVKKVGSPEKETARNKLVKAIEMPIVETEIQKDKSLETNDKEETIMGAIAKVTEKNENAIKSTGSIKEKDKLILLKKELVTGSKSEKMLDNPVANYTEQIEKHILSKSEAISEIKSTLDALQLSVKKEKKKSASNGSTFSSNTTGEEKAVTLSSEVIEESEVEKFIVENKKLLGNEHGSECVSGLKDKQPSPKDRKAMKRKRKSKDLTESPKRKKVAKRHSDILDTPKALDVLRPGSNSIDSS